MANYFDNQEKWSWQISDKAALVTTDHGTHTHTVDVTDVPIGEMVDHTGQVMGDAHRAASHDFKEDIDLSGVENMADTAVPAPSADDEALDDGEACEDGLDI